MNEPTKHDSEVPEVSEVQAFFVPLCFSGSCTS